MGKMPVGAGRRKRLDELAERFIIGLGNIFRSRGALFREEMEKYGITIPQFHLLMMVKFHGRITVTDLSHCMQVAVPTASRMIDMLYLKGLLTREKDERDHRVTYIVLTETGNKVLNAMAECQKSLVVQIFKGEDQAKLEALVEYLEKFGEKILSLKGRQ